MRSGCWLFDQAWSAVPVSRANGPAEPRSVAIRSLVTDPRVGNLLSCGVQVREASAHT
jgi:hypothetical protein